MDRRCLSTTLCTFPREFSRSGFDPIAVVVIIEAWLPRLALNADFRIHSRVVLVSWSLAVPQPYQMALRFCKPVWWMTRANPFQEPVSC